MKSQSSKQLLNSLANSITSQYDQLSLWGLRARSGIGPLTQLVMRNSYQKYLYCIWLIAKCFYVTSQRKWLAMFWQIMETYSQADFPPCQRMWRIHLNKRILTTPMTNDWKFSWRRNGNTTEQMCLTWDYTEAPVITAQVTKPWGHRLTLCEL